MECLDADDAQIAFYTPAKMSVCEDPADEGIVHLFALDNVI
jgi:hypothetical protein